MKFVSNYSIDKSLEYPRWIPVSVHALRSDQCRASSMANLAPKITTSTNTSPPTYFPPIRCQHCPTNGPTPWWHLFPSDTLGAVEFWFNQLASLNALLALFTLAYIPYFTTLITPLYNYSTHLSIIFSHFR